MESGGANGALAEGSGLNRDVIVHSLLGVQFRNCQPRVGPISSFPAFPSSMTALS